MTPIDLAAIRDRDAKTDYWQVTGGSVVCADRRALLKFVDAIPPEYIVQPPPPAPRPDRDRIRRDIKAGKDVPGCHLLATERLEIKC